MRDGRKAGDGGWLDGMGWAASCVFERLGVVMDLLVAFVVLGGYVF